MHDPVSADPGVRAGRLSEQRQLKKTKKGIAPKVEIIPRLCLWATTRRRQSCLRVGSATALHISRTVHDRFTILRPKKHGRRVLNTGGAQTRSSPVAGALGTVSPIVSRTASREPRRNASFQGGRTVLVYVQFVSLALGFQLYVQHVRK